MLCCHNFPDIGCFSNFTFTDTHTSLLNLNLSFLHYFIPTLQNFTEEKKSKRNLEVSSCNAANSPLSLNSPSSSHHAGFYVHLPPQPPVNLAPNSHWKSSSRSPFWLQSVSALVSQKRGDRKWCHLALSYGIISVSWITMMKTVHLSPCLLSVLEKKDQCRKNKEQDTGIWESPGNVGAHHKLEASLERAQNCRAYPVL